MKKAVDYLLDYKTEQLLDKSINTISGYMTDLKQFFLFMKNKLEQLTNEDIKKYIEHMVGKRYKTKTINRKLISIKRYVNYLNTQTDIKIFVDIKIIKIQRQDYLQDVLTKSDFDRLVNAAEKEGDIRALAIFNTLYLTGARVSEMLQLKLADIGQDTIPVKGKGEKYRDLFVPDSLKEVLNDYVRGREGSKEEYLFINENKEVLTRQTVHNIIKHYAGISKVKLSRAHAHNFRHLYAFRLLEMGLSSEEIADLLGHSDINTTKIYTRKTKNELINTIKRLK